MLKSECFPSGNLNNTYILLVSLTDQKSVLQVFFKSLEFNDLSKIFQDRKTTNSEVKNALLKYSN